MSEQCPLSDGEMPEMAEASPEMSATVWWMMWTGLLKYVIPGFLSKIFAFHVANATETEFSTLCSTAAAGVLVCEVRRLWLLLERVLKEINRWRECLQQGCNAERDQIVTENPTLSLSVTDVQAYDTRVVMAAAFLGGGSTWLARLTSYAVLPLDDSNERWRLAILWSAITWIAVGVSCRWLGPETADWTGLACVIAMAGTCLGPLQRILIAFTPVSERGDFACCVGLAALHAACIVYAGRHSNAAVGFMCSLCVWLCLVATLATLPPPNPEKVAARVQDKVKRKLAIEALCKKTEEVALDLSSKGFHPLELLQEYLKFEGTRDDTVMKVLSNQISNADRKMVRAGDVAAPTSNALPPLKESKGFRDVYFVGGDKVGIGELLLETSDPRIEGRIFAVANVQRPTVIGVTRQEAEKLLIVGKSDIERNTSLGTALLTQDEQEIFLDMDEVEAMSSYRRGLLQIVVTNDRESWGSIRSGWSATIELYLLVNASVLMAGWYIVRRTAGPQPIRAPILLMAAVFSGFIGMMQPADYQAAPRLLDRWTSCLRGRGMHLSARNDPARTTMAWAVMALTFGILCWQQASKDKNENVFEVLHEMHQEVFFRGGAKKGEGDAEDVQRLLRGAQGRTGEEGDCVYCKDWVYACLWLGSYWVIWIVDAVVSHRAGRKGRLVKPFSRGTP